MDKENTEKFMKTIDDFGLSSVDNEKFSNDLKELNDISNSLPKDNVYSSEDCLRLERLCLRGMNICDYWTPIIHIVLSEKEAERDATRGNAYIHAGKEGSKITVEMRKALADTNITYNNIRVITEKIKGIKLFFDKKRDTLKSAIFVFRDQIVAYKLSDKGIEGENMENW
ncbi:MAG: hypothetical protein ACOYMA_00205 [Bacteroidia bacterium]